MTTRFTHQRIPAGKRLVRKFLAVTLGVFLVITFVSSAEAAVKIEAAMVQNGVAFIQGTGAVKGAPIFWEGSAVTTANKNNGGFSFFGVVPNDCVGALSDQPGGATPINVQVLDCTPASAATAPVPRTGQTTSYAARDDGALQKGVASPNPRFTDNNNGTITDNLTGLIWLKNANCPGASRVWPGMDPARTAARDDVGQLNTDGTMNGNYCGDTSNAGSHQTDWRLPNVRELQSLVDYGVNVSPVLPLGHPFLNFQAIYWSSSTYAYFPDSVWFVIFAQGPFINGGIVFPGGSVGQTGKDNQYYIIAVRGGS
jgi:hypothetical protein